MPINNNIYLVTLYNALYDLWINSPNSSTFTGLTVNGNLYATTISATTYLNLPSSSFSGGTITGPTNFTNGLTANTISATTYYGLPIDVYVTGGTFSSGTATFTNNTGGTFNVSGFGTGSVGSFTGGTVTGATEFTDGLTANTISATTYINLPIDVYVTGGTYSTGTATFTNNTGGTFSVSGFSTSTGVSFTGGTVSGATNFTSTISSGGTDLNAIFVQPNTVQTITNKRISKRVVSVASSATPAFNTDNGDIARLTGLTTNVTNFSTNLSGSPAHGDLFCYEITDSGVARTLSWGSSFSASGTLSLPTTTVISTMLRLLFQWNSATSTWMIVGWV